MLEETKERFKNIYNSKKDTVEWMLAYGTDFEKMQASIIKQVALTK